MIPTFVCLPSDAAEFKQLFRDKLVLHILGVKRSTKDVKHLQAGAERTIISPATALLRLAMRSCALTPT